MAFLEFLAAAAGARIVAADILQGVAHRLLVAVVAMRAMHVSVVVGMIVIVVAVRAMDVGLLGHARLLRKKITGNYHAIARHVHATAEQ